MWSGIAAGAAALGGALLSSDAARSAGNAQSNATGAATAEQRREFDLTRQDTAPYRAGGASAFNYLRTLLGVGPQNSGPIGADYSGSLVDVTSGVPAPNQDLYASDPGYRKAWDDYAMAHQARYQSGYTSASDPTVIDREVRSRLPQAGGQPAAANTGQPDASQSPLLRKFSVSDFWNDPVVQLGYQSGLDLGVKALKNRAPLTTGLDSGAAAKELVQFGTDYAGRTMAEPAYARFTNDQGNQFNRLAALAGIGQTAVGQTMAAGTNTANNVSNLITGQGNANAAARVAGANAWGGGLQSVANWWQSQNMLNRLTNNGQGWNTAQPAAAYNPSWNMG